MYIFMPVFNLTIMNACVRCCSHCTWYISAKGWMRVGKCIKCLVAKCERSLSWRKQIYRPSGIHNIAFCCTYLGFIDAWSVFAMLNTLVSVHGDYFKPDTLQILQHSVHLVNCIGIFLCLDLKVKSEMITYQIVIVHAWDCMQFIHFAAFPD